MASAAKATLVTGKSTESPKVVDFQVEELVAPFVLRCAALCVDYMFLLMIPALWLTFGRFLGDGGLPSIGWPIWIVGVIVLATNVVMLPILKGQSIGKLIMGITIVNLDGTRAHAGRILMRNTVGYSITLLTAGLGFLLSMISANGRALHDLLAGTVVIRGTRRQV